MAASFRSGAARVARRWLAPALVVLSLPVAAAAQQHPTPDAAAIRAMLDSTAAGWNRGDLVRYLSIYTPDVTSMGRDGFVRGKDAAERVMREGFWRTGRPLQQLHYEHVDVRMLGSDHALVTGQYVLTGGGHPDRTGWFTTVWTRTEEGWRCMHDHSS